MRRVRRLPILLLLPALIIGAFIVQNRESEVSGGAVRLNEMVPTASPDDALSSTWYCPAGTATGVTSGESAGFAEQTLTIANASSIEATGVVTAYNEKGDTALKAVTIGAHSQRSLRVSEILTAPWASALVEVSGGGITVTHELRGPAGRSMSACASGPNALWYFPSGTTRAGTRNLVALFNPFPGEATIDFSFDTEEGTRTPQQLQGMVVPGGRLVIVDVGAIVTLRERVSTTVSVRIGRVIAEQIQTGDGRNGIEQGLTAVLGATAVASLWTFPVATPASTSAREVVSVMNTGDTDTEVQVEVLLDDPSSNGSVEPFVLAVPSNRAAQIDLGSDPRIPKSVGRWLIVRSASNAPIVAERSIGMARTATAGGLTFTMGVPVLATAWLGTVAGTSDLSATLLAVANPSATTTATVTVSINSKGGVTAASAAREIRVLPGQRLLVNLSPSTTGITDASVQVESDQPVVVGQWMTSATPLEFFTISDFPVVGTESLPGDVFSPDQSVAVSAEGSPEVSIPAVSSTMTTITPTTIATTTTVAGATTTAVR